MKTLACKDIDPSLTCDYVATGNDDAEVMANMTAHAAVEHADNAAGVNDDVMRPHIKDIGEPVM